ncbi:MAG TPA: hypothetical protein DCX95_00540 [Elusimicrobia bacterium]|nr:hypothetical protein [Elusimicrobiota bacterium]
MKKLLLFLLCSTSLITSCSSKDRFFEPMKINSSASINKAFTNFDTGFGIISIAVDDKYVWFATDNGVVVFDKIANEWGKCILENFSPSWCNIYVDADSVWVGGERGLAKFDKIRKKWKVYTTKDGLIGNDISEIVGSKKFIGVICRERGTEWKGLSIFDKASNKWIIHIPISNLPNSKEYNEIYTITFDNDKIWIGAMSGLSRFNIKTYKFEDTNFDLRNVRFLLPDNDTIWIGTFGDGVWKFDAKTKNWIKYNINCDQNMIMDSERIIANRYASFIVFNKKNAESKEYRINKYFPASMFILNEITSVR